LKKPIGVSLKTWLEILMNRKEELDEVYYLAKDIDPYIDYLEFKLKTIKDMLEE
jgi:hypothetical protein